MRGRVQTFSRVNYCQNPLSPPFFLLSSSEPFAFFPSFHAFVCLFLFLSFFLSFSLSHSLSFPLFFSHSLSFSLSLSFFLSFSLSLSLSFLLFRPESWIRAGHVLTQTMRTQCRETPLGIYPCFLSILARKHNSRQHPVLTLLNVKPASGKQQLNNFRPGFLFAGNVLFYQLVKNKKLPWNFAPNSESDTWRRKKIDHREGLTSAWN